MSHLYQTFKEKQEPLTHNVSRLPAQERIAAIFGGCIRKGLIPSVWLRGRHYYVSGIYQRGLTDDAVYCLSHYFWYGDPSLRVSAYGDQDEDRMAAIADWFAANHRNNVYLIRRGKWGQLWDKIFRVCTWRARDFCPSEAFIAKRLTAEQARRANLKKRMIVRTNVSEAIAKYGMISISKLELITGHTRRSISRAIKDIFPTQTLDMSPPITPVGCGEGVRGRRSRKREKVMTTIDEIKAREKLATAGPWEVSLSETCCECEDFTSQHAQACPIKAVDGIYAMPKYRERIVETDLGNYPPFHHDAQFIATRSNS